MLWSAKIEATRAVLTMSLGSNSDRTAILMLSILYVEVQESEKNCGDEWKGFMPVINSRSLMTCCNELRGRNTKTDGVLQDGSFSNWRRYQNLKSDLPVPDKAAAGLGSGRPCQSQGPQSKMDELAVSNWRSQDSIRNEECPEGEMVELQTHHTVVRCRTVHIYTNAAHQRDHYCVNSANSRPTKQYHNLAFPLRNEFVLSRTSSASRSIVFANSLQLGTS